MFVVEEAANNVMRVYGYDNESDPYQLIKIQFDELKNGIDLRTELARLLRETNDSWYKERVFEDFIGY